MPTGEKLDEPVPEEGLRDLMSRLASDARAYAKAEAMVVREAAAGRARAARGGVVMLVLSVALASGGATALIVGLLLTVSASVGPMWATVIVVGVTLLFSALVGFVGWARVKRAWRGNA